MKKLICAFATIIVCCLLSVHAFADTPTSGQQAFVGGRYDGFTGPFQLPNCEISGKWVIQYSDPYIYYYNLPANTVYVSVQLLSNGDKRVTFPSGTVVRTIAYYPDSANSTVDYGDRIDPSFVTVADYTYNAIYSNVPFSDGSNIIFEPSIDDSGSFHLHGYLDDDLIMHYSVSYDGSRWSTISPDDDVYNVSFYVVDGQSNVGTVRGFVPSNFDFNFFTNGFSKSWLEEKFNYDVEQATSNPFYPIYRKEEKLYKGAFGYFDDDTVTEVRNLTLPSPSLFLDADTVSTTKNAFADLDCVE